MVELVDTLVSGTRAFTGVQVQVLFRATAVLYRTAFFMNKSPRCNALASNVCSGHVQSRKETAFFLQESTPLRLACGVCSGQPAVSFETAFFYNKNPLRYALLAACVPGSQRFLLKPLFFITRLHVATPLLATCVPGMCSLVKRLLFCNKNPLRYALLAACVPGRQRFLLKPLFFYNKIARCYALACGVCSGHVAVLYRTAFF